MDGQGIEPTILLPTLGVGMETALEHDTEALTAAFGAFNRWLLEDWGFNHQDRIYGAPIPHASRSRIGRWPSSSTRSTTTPASS